MELQQLLSETAQRKASDLHLKSGSKPILRIHGHLEVQDDLPMVTRERSEEHTSELQSLRHLVCRLLLEKKKKSSNANTLTPDDSRIRLARKIAFIAECDKLKEIFSQTVHTQRRRPENYAENCCDVCLS